MNSSLTLQNQRNKAQAFYEKVNADMRLHTDRTWIKTFNLTEWRNQTSANLDEYMGKGNVVVIENSGLNAGWSYDMTSAAKIKTPSHPVDVQGIHYFDRFCDANSFTD